MHNVEVEVYSSSRRSSRRCRGSGSSGSSSKKWS